MNKQKQLSVSVLMPVYNAAPFICRAIDSIQTQTYTQFELVIVNDGSTDTTLERIKSYNDTRIRIINLSTNQGLVAALNAGLDSIQADYIIRMDADEICYPERFAKQIQFMESNLTIGVSATWYKIMGGKVMELGCTPEELKYQLLNRSPFPHSGVIMRGALFSDGSLRYNPMYEFAEDLELWMRLIRVTAFANIPEVLLEVTLNSGQLSKNLTHSSRHNQTLRKEYLKYLFPQLKEPEAILLSTYLNRILPNPLHKTEFLEMLTLCNNLSQTTKDKRLDKQLSEAIWFQLANNAPHSIGWIVDVRKYTWVEIPVWKYGWLLVKPLVTKLKGLK
jgi:glycosyltransferase involved in cell wall biosynthesis